MKKGDIKRGGEGSQGKSGPEKEKRLNGITLLPAGFRFKLYFKELRKRKNQG